MKITNKKRFIISNLILLSIIFMLIYMSKGTLSTSIVSYTETYVEEGDTLWQRSHMIIPRPSGSSAVRKWS